jgi:hypothetical protein
MNHILRVKILEGFTHLSDVIGGNMLRVASILLLLEVLVELATRGILQNQIYFFIVPEEAIHPEDILMTEVRLDLDLPSKLMLHV